jgi:hypothetical protein
MHMFDWDDDYMGRNDDRGKLIVEPEYVPPPRQRKVSLMKVLGILIILALVCLVLAAGLFMGSLW